MSGDAFQQEALRELGLPAWRYRPPGSEAPPADARTLALLARALRVTPAALAASGVRLPPWERLRDPAVKRALWPGLREWLAR